MEVILLKDTEFGDKGSVVKVKNGFARNYLFPNNVAVENTPGNQEHVQGINAQQQKKLAKEKAEVEALVEKISKASAVEIKAKAGENGQLFGAITHQQIADALNAALGTQIDRRRVQLKGIKEAGDYEAPLRLTFGLTAMAKIKVVAEVEKKQESATKKSRKPRKKEEIAAEIEAQEKAETPQASDEAFPS